MESLKILSMKYIILLLVTTLSLAACQQNAGEASYESNGAYYKTTQAREEAEADELAAPQERKIIKTANIRFQVEDVKVSTEAVERATKAHAGFISNVNQSNSNYSKDASMTIRVPIDQLDIFLKALEEESIYTDYNRMSAQDVTEEYFDLATRLKTKKAVRDRYIEILRNRAKTVKDILEAEEKIRVIQEEIESTEGRLKYLTNQTAMSTVHLQMYQEVAYVKSPTINRTPFWARLGEGFDTGWALIQSLVIGLESFGPLVLILIGLLLLRNRFFSWSRS